MRHLASYGPASLSRAVGVACTVSLHIIIARSVGPDLYAAVAFFVTVFSLAGLVLDFGNEQQLIREGVSASPRARTVLTFAPLFALLLITGLLSSASVLETTFSIPGLPSIFFWGVPALLLWALQILPRSEMQRAQRFRSIAGIEAAGSIIAWLTAVVLFLRTQDPAFYGLYTLLIYGVRTVLYWLRARIRLSQVQGPVDIRQYFGSWKLLAISAGNRLTTTYDDLVVAASFGASMLGVYHLSYRVITLMQDFIAGVLRTLSYPVYAAQSDETAVVYRQFCLDSKLVFAVTAPLLTLLMLTADWSIPLILTDRWTGAVLIFQLLALEAYRQSMLPLAGQALIAIAKEGVLLRYSIVSVLVLLPVFTLLGLFDLTALVLGFVAINTVLNIPAVASAAARMAARGDLVAAAGGRGPAAALDRYRRIHVRYPPYGVCPGIDALSLPLSLCRRGSRHCVSSHAVRVPTGSRRRRCRLHPYRRRVQRRQSASQGSA